MSNLYFGVCPYGTICDVFINTLAGWSNNWIQPCTPVITETGHLIHYTHEKYVLDLTNNNPMTFRDIDWTNRLGDIEVLLDGSGNKNLWIGSFHEHQAHIIKRHFGDDAVTIGIGYDTCNRNLILENVIAYHDIFSITDKLEYYVEFNKKYYTRKSHWDKMVPERFEPFADVSIDIETFLNPDKYIKELELLDGARNEKQLEYYFTWLYKTKERLNENF